MANSASLKDELELAVGDALNSSIGLTGGAGTDENSVGPGLGGGGSRNLDEMEEEIPVQPTGRFIESTNNLEPANPDKESQKQLQKQ